MERDGKFNKGFSRKIQISVSKPSGVRRFDSEQFFFVKLKITFSFPHFYNSATLFNFAAVTSFAWTSPSIPQLLVPGGPVQITVDQGTWIVSCLKLGQVIGPIPSAWIMNRSFLKTFSSNLKY